MGIFSSNARVFRQSYGDDFHITIAIEMPEGDKDKDGRDIAIQMLTDIMDNLLDDFSQAFRESKAVDKALDLKLNIPKFLYQLIADEAINKNIPLDKFIMDCLALGVDRQKLLK